MIQGALFGDFHDEETPINEEEAVTPVGAESPLETTNKDLPDAASLQPSSVDPEVGVLTEDADHFDPEIIHNTSAPFVGEWLGLVSQTNWEKGKIIHRWRDALVAAGAPAQAYSDEAWARHFEGTVTGQHVGRLRRVFDKFGDSQNDYPHLSWTHFQAAMDWSDAEMWLEGAVQEKWSVATMRKNRWEAMGAISSEKPVDSDLVYAELDEDGLAPFEPPTKSTYAPGDNTIRGSFDAAANTEHFEGPDFGDPDWTARSAVENRDGAAKAVETTSGQEVSIQPFKDLPDLPADIQVPLDNLKIALLRHKTNLWEDVESKTVVGYLHGLIQMLQTSVPDSDNAADHHTGDGSFYS